jgi:tetratricopeptide (TPR) repeat protein
VTDPLVQALLAATDPAEKAAIVAESVFSDLPDERALIARRCVVLHWFDQPIISGLSPENSKQDSAEIHKQLAALPFVEAVPWGLAYHELTRQGLLNRYANTQPELLITAARLAAPVYAAGGEDETIAAEAFFCYTIAGESETAIKLLDELLAQAGSRQDWGYFASILKIQDEAEALPFVQPLTRLARHWRARGLARYSQGDLGGALADLDRAIALEENNAWALALRGETYRKMGEYEQALADLDRAIALDEKYAWALALRGEIYRRIGE